MNSNFLTNFSTKFSFPIKKKYKVLLIIGAFGLMVFGSFLFNVLAITAVTVGKPDIGYKLFQLTQPMVSTTSLLFLNQWSLLNFWKEEVIVGKELSLMISNSAKSDDLLASFMADPNQESLLTHLDLMLAQAEKSPLLIRLFYQQNLDVKEIKKLVVLLKTLNQEKLAGKKYLLLFQNTDEVRATGGFIGSYAVLDFSRQDFYNLEIRDIYDPSGISPKKPSPKGQDFYLSGGEGLALHDANWQPEFASSVTDILWFFSRIDRDPQTYDGVIALNFSTIERMVDWLGEIYLPDEKSFVDANDLFMKLREDRAEFFPGSKQKEYQLSALKTAFLLKLESLTMEDLTLFGQRFLSDGLWKEVQFFAHNPETEKVYSQLDVAGDLYRYQPQDLYVFPVESNVGINKVNRWVSRNIEFTKVDQILRMNVSFTNQALVAERPVLNETNPAYKTADHLGYINYYRLITSPNLSLISVKVGDEVLTDWDSETFTAMNGQSYNQFGFLVTVAELNKKEVTVDFLIKDEIDQFNVTLQKQIGIFYWNKTKQFSGNRFLKEVVK